MPPLFEGGGTSLIQPEAVEKIDILLPATQLTPPVCQLQTSLEMGFVLENSVSIFIADLSIAQFVENLFLKSLGTVNKNSCSGEGGPAVNYIAGVENQFIGHSLISIISSSPSGFWITPLICRHCE